VERPLRQQRLRRLALAAAAAKRAWVDACTARDDEIEAADNEDRWSLREIADHTGLHHGSVARIVATRTAERQARLAAAVGV
jgi:hypothetical protein